MSERPVSLLDWAYKQVRRMLFSGALPQGQKIVVAQLANQLSISPTPVKEALNRLAAEGLLEAVPRRGFQVKRQSIKEVKDTLECRIMLETYAATKAVDNFSSRPDLQEEMRQAMENLRSTDPHDYVSITELEQSFHGALVQLAENETLFSLFNILYGVGFSSFVYAASYRPQKAQSEHQTIYDALVNHDLALLTSTLQEHLNRTIEFYANFSAQNTDLPVLQSPASLPTGQS
ncbi:MAG TPA: GntR family transcriptional regulator [Candidatus Egerieimonas intestinavium]|uniref:GntR family transcriptional regulator n=1 Tax=Candidatus Egerieimonas intestinavium TaxID=2840777 RepID=A0A9D1JEY6_9FIRM|nr:GntR family transcriptional regulator [Candidatus Egerieimonas intestinavium]